MVFLFTSHGQLFGQLIDGIHRFALSRDIVGELVLPIAGSILLVTYYLHKEGKIHEIVKYSYQKVKIWRLNIPMTIPLLLCGIVVYSISISPIIDDCCRKI